MRITRFLNTTPQLSVKGDWSSLLIRLAFGGAMLVHGWGKYQRLVEGGEIHFADPIGVGEVPSLVLTVFAELVCSALLVMGLYTRWALVPLIFTMGVAQFVVHGADTFANRELSMLYGVAHLVVFILGPGRFSLDRQFRR